MNLNDIKLFFTTLSNYINTHHNFYSFQYEFNHFHDADLYNESDHNENSNDSNKNNMMFAKKSKKSKKSSEVSSDPMDIYLRASVSSGQEGIVSNKLKGIVFGFVSIILVFFGIASYLNSQNPIIDLLRETNKPFAVNMIDENYIKYFSSVTKNYTKRDYIMPKPLKNSLLALHHAIQDSNPSLKCPLHLKKAEYFKDYACETSYQYFLLNVMLGENSALADTGIISSIINSNQGLKEYLLLSWMKSNMSDNDFYNLYFSNTYYGNAIVGAHTAADYYFQKTPEQLDLAESIFLIYKIYTTNKSLYTPNPDINYDTILESFIKLDFIVPSDIEDIKYLISQIQEKQISNSFMRYIEEDFLEAYKLFRKQTVVTLKNTFLLALQNSLIKITSMELEKNNIPNASVLVVKNNNIFASFTLGLDKDKNGKTKPVFFSTFPYVKTYSAIKPFLYLTLLENQIDISTVLINARYQNLIFTYNLYKNYQNEDSRLQMQDIAPETPVSDAPSDPTQTQVISNTNNQVAIKNTATPVTNISILSNTNLDRAPDSVRKYFASQLNDLEQSFMLKLEANKYMAGLRKYDLDMQNIQTTEDIIDHKGILSLEKIFYAYSVFLNYGEIKSLRHINLINQKNFPFESKTLGTYNKEMINILKGLYFNKLEFANSKSRLYYVLDVNFGVVFSDEYLAIFWFGDFNNPDVADANYVSSLQVILKSLGDLLRN